MSDVNSEKIVDFYKYCGICKHSDKKESEDPCYDCLEEFTNTDSHKPVKWEEK